MLESYTPRERGIIEECERKAKVEYNKLFKEMCHYKSKCVDLMCELDNKKAKFDKLRKKLKEYIGGRQGVYDDIDYIFDELSSKQEGEE